MKCCGIRAFSASDNNTGCPHCAECCRLLCLECPKCCHLLRADLRCLCPKSIDGCLLVLRDLLELSRQLCLCVVVLLLDLKLLLEHLLFGLLLLPFQSQSSCL